MNPRRLLPAVLLLAFGSSPLWAFFNPIRDLSREALEAMKRGKYDRAVELYEKALKEDPADPVLRYNLGSAQSQKGDNDKARENLEKALATAPADLKPKVLYHLGNNAMRGESFEDAIKHYVETLRLAPDDRDAKWNLELARTRLREQSQKQQNRQNQQTQDKKSNANRHNESGGEKQTKGADRFDQPHDSRKPGQQSPQGSPQQGSKGGQGQGGTQEDKQRSGGGVGQTPAGSRRLTPEESEQLLQALQDKQNRTPRPFTPDQSMPNTPRGKDW